MRKQALFFMIALLLAAAGGQQRPKRPVSSGVMTGVAHPPVKDAERCPITAGGWVEEAPVIFSDITDKAGLDKFHHRSR